MNHRRLPAPELKNQETVCGHKSFLRRLHERHGGELATGVYIGSVLLFTQSRAQQLLLIIQAYSTQRRYKLKKESLNKQLNKQLMCFCLHTSAYAHTHVHIRTYTHKHLHTHTHTHTYTRTHTHTHQEVNHNIPLHHCIMERGYISQFQNTEDHVAQTLSPLRLFTQQEWEDIRNTSRDHVLLLRNSNFLRDLHS